MSIPGAASPLFLAATAAGPAGDFEISRSLRFNSGDSAHLSKTFASAGNRRTWTWSAWAKLSSIGTGRSRFFGASGSNTGSPYNFAIDIGLSGNKIVFTNYANDIYLTDAVFRDVSAWYHIVVALDTTDSTTANRVKIYVNGVLQDKTYAGHGASAAEPTQNIEYAINNNEPHNIGATPAAFASLTAYSFLDGYLADVHFIDGQALAATDFGAPDDNGVWQPKKFAGTYGTNGFHLDFKDNSSSAALGTDTSGNSNTWTVNNLTASAGNENHVTGSQSFKDSTSANQTWDSSSNSSSTSNAIGVDDIYWVDLGSSKSFNEVTYTVVGSGQNNDSSPNFIIWYSTSSSSRGSSICNSGCTVTNVPTSSGSLPGTITGKFSGFAAQTARYIGITNGASTYGGTYTYSNFQVSLVTPASDLDSLVDTPSQIADQTDTGAGGEVVGNYATWNPVQPTFATTSFSNGNLDCSLLFTNGSATPYAVGNFVVSSGKWYWEITLTQESNNTEYIGIISGSKASGAWAFADVGAYFSDARKAIGASPSSYGTSYTTGDVIGIALDADNGNLTFYKNGVSQGAAATGMTGFNGYKPFTSSNGTSTAQLTTANFGQRAFAHPVSGYKSLNTANFDPPTIADGSLYFDTTLWSGNGSTQAISGLSFSPDLIWGKRRDSTNSHWLMDVVRGAGQRLISNETSAESDKTDIQSAFNSDGFTIGNNTESNASGGTYVSWNWDAGTGSPATNNNGSIASQVRAQPSAGFSICTYTGNGSGGATFGHGLNADLGMCIIACRNTTNYWDTWHSGYYVAGSKNYIRLQSTGAAGYASDMFGTPTSSVVTLGSSGSMNGSGNTYVAYCFAPVAGYSAMGSYTGNGSATDGPFVYTGFRPAFIMGKRTDGGTDNWFMNDSSRFGYNDKNIRLYPNLSLGEGSSSDVNMDILSNGFKLISSNSNSNGSGATYIYYAVAENPFKTARAR